MVFQLDGFQISQKPHAFDLDNVYIDNSGMHVPAVWLLKTVRLTAYSGVIYTPMVSVPQELLGRRSKSSAGFTHAKWDGERLWAPNMTWEEMVDRQSLLSEMLEHLGEPPEGYTGWYTLANDNDSDISIIEFH